MSKQKSSMTLAMAIGEICDTILEETDLADLRSYNRSKFVRYSSIAAAASFGIALTYFFVRGKVPAFSKAA